MLDSRQNGGVKEWFSEWVNSLGFTKLRLCTQASYKQQVWPFIEYAEIAKLDPLDFRTVEKYLSFLQFERKLAGSSASLAKKCIRVFLRWLYRRGYPDRWIATALTHSSCYRSQVVASIRCYRQRKAKNDNFKQECSDRNRGSP